MKCKEIQEKNKISLQLLNKKKIQKLKEKGITLIALVVTIIILLILTGVTLNMALSGDGLFSKARQAADKYRKAQKDETELISEIGKEMNSEYIGGYITGYMPTGGTCTITKEQSGVVTEITKDSIGKEIKKDGNGNQTFTTTAEGELNWKIWDYDGTILRIILDKPMTQKLALKGAEGYNNGVWAINEICRQCFGQYEGNGDNKKMKEGISVTNLRRSDIQKVSTYDYTEYKHKLNPQYWDEELEESNEQIRFGEAKKYSNENVKYPAMFGLNDQKWNYEYKNKEKIGEDKECSLWEKEENNKVGKESIMQSESIQFKNSYYCHNYKYKENQFKNIEYYKMILSQNNGEKIEQVCWLSGRFVQCSEGEVFFGLNCIDQNDGDTCFVSGGWLFTSFRE